VIEVGSGTTLRAVAALVVAALLVACKSVPIPVFETIAVPAGLSSQQVELAILAGIVNKPPPKDIDPARTYTDAEFQKIIWDDYLRDARGRSWFPESRAPGVIYAAVDTRGHYLRVALRFDQTSISTEIVESRNLLQEEGQIHKRALSWIENLHDHIKRELTRLAFVQTPGT
jgi:hypothetical protein